MPLQRPKVELGVNRHDRKPLGQLGAGNLAEAILLVEAVSGEELGCGSQVDLAHTARLAPSEESFQQTLGDAILGTSMRGADEHLAQGRLGVPDIQQAHGAHDLAVVQRDPEVAIALLVEAGDVAQIRLGVERDGNFELGLLNWKDDRDDAIGVL